MNAQKTLLALAVATAFAGSAQAQVLVDDWTMDLRGVDGLAIDAKYKEVAIDKITFTAKAHVNSLADTVVANGTPDIGERFTVDGLGIATSFVNDSTGVIPSFLNLDYEITFDWSVRNQYAAVPSGFGFTHLQYGTDGVDGLLEFYVDNLTDVSNVTATPGTGAGYTDAVKIATFRILAGGGGPFNTGTWDGSDDATFELVSALTGVLWDSTGTQDLGLLVAGGTPVLLGLTTSNFDADKNNDGTPEVAGGGFTCVGTLADFCADEEGALRLATQAVPEPGTLGLLGLGLMGLAAVGRRRRA